MDRHVSLELKQFRFRLILKNVYFVILESNQEYINGILYIYTWTKSNATINCMQIFYVAIPSDYKVNTMHNACIYIIRQNLGHPNKKYRKPILNKIKKLTQNTWIYYAIFRMYCVNIGCFCFIVNNMLTKDIFT